MRGFCSWFSRTNVLCILVDRNLFLPEGEPVLPPLAVHEPVEEDDEEQPTESTAQRKRPESIAATLEGGGDSVRLGIPSVGIMTSKFVSAAELMARALGAEGYPFVVVDHPISSATTEALTRRARKAVAESVAILRGSKR